MKVDKVLVTISCIVFTLIVAMGRIVYLREFAPCVSCGYITYQDQVDYGYRTRDSDFCRPCSQAADPTITRLGTSRIRALQGCPKMYTDEYNAKVKLLNTALMDRGFNPKFEIINEKK